MDCDQAVEAISAALDGELSPGEQARLEEHLEGCGACRALAADFASISAALDLGEQDPPPGLQAEILAAVAAQGRAPGGRGKRRRYLHLAAAAAVAALCLGGAYLSAGGTVKANSSGGAAAPAAPQVNGEAAPAGEDLEMVERPASTAGAERAGETEAETDYAFGDMERAGVEADGAWMSLVGDNGGDAPANNHVMMEAVAAEPMAAPVPEPEEAVGGEKLSLTREDALELAFVHLGGLDAYPGAELREEDAGLCYVLSDGAGGRWLLDGGGLSEDGSRYVFRLVREEDGRDTVQGYVTVTARDGQVEDGGP